MPKHTCTHIILVLLDLKLYKGVSNTKGYGGKTH